MIIINLKDLYPSDSQQQLADKANYNFNQLLRLGVGQQGPVGPPGPIGPQGIIGPIGSSGVRGSYWYSGNYADPMSDPTMYGSPNPKNINDCYLACAAGNLSMWQYIAPGVWVETIDLENAIASHMTMTSPFERPTGSPPPPNWSSIILPLVVPNTGEWNNTLLLATEYQSNLYNGSYFGINSVMLRRTQLSLLNGSAHYSSPYSLMIGEIGYDYSAGVPITANPRVRMNNTLRISTKHKHAVSPPTSNPLYTSSVFDMLTPDDGTQADDTTTAFNFKSRHFDGVDRASLNAYFGGKRAWTTGFGLSTLDDIAYTTVEMGGMLLTNQYTTCSAIALGTDLNLGGITPYGYLLTNNNVNRIYVNQHWVPFRPAAPSKIINLGCSGEGADKHWDGAYLKNTIGYIQNSDMKVWRGTDVYGYAANDSNCVVAFTKEGRVAVGKSEPYYTGAGVVDGMGYGIAPTASGNSNNRAVVHIYDDVTAMPTVMGLDEAGLVIEKRWGYLDTHPSVTGKKIGGYIHNNVYVTSSSIGLGTATAAPNAAGFRVLQGQTSTDLIRGVVSEMSGMEIYAYASANSAHIGRMIGISVASELQYTNPGVTTTRVTGEYRAVSASVMSKINGVTEFVLGTDEGRAKRYGFYQDGATDAINRLDGHLQFGGTGSGYSLPFYGSVTGHVIHSRATGSAGNIYIMSSAASSGVGGTLMLSGGPAVDGGNGGTTFLTSGASSGTTVSNAGDILIYPGWAIGTNKTAGSIYMTGGLIYGTTGSVNEVCIGPSALMHPISGITTAGTIAIGYWKMTSSSTPYNVGNVGFGTIVPQAKVQIMGDLLFGAKYGSSARKIGVRPGVSTDNMDNEAVGNGSDLIISAGSGSGLVSPHIYTGGDIYIYGGTYSAPVMPLTPPHLAYEGDTILGCNETDVARGRVGIRKKPPTSVVDDYEIHVDVLGNTRIDGDLMFGGATIPGWEILVDKPINTAWPAGNMVRLFSGSDMTPVELTYSQLSMSAIYIAVKRIGTVGIVNFHIQLAGVMSATTSFLWIAWNSSHANNSAFGTMLPSRSPGIVNPPNAAYASGYGWDSARLNVDCNAAYTVGAYGAIPTGYNTVYLNNGSTASMRTYVGQIIVPMANTI